MDQSEQADMLSAIDDGKSQGLTIVEVIKLVHLRFGLPLSEAKTIVSSHPCWAATVQAAKPLHDEALRIATEIGRAK